MSYCNNCDKTDCGGGCGGCDPCKKGCSPAKYDGSFNIQIDPFDDSTWVVTWNCVPHRIRVPKTRETDTFLSTNYTDATLNYKSEKHTDKITGEQLGSLINLNDLRDVSANAPENCSFLVFNPGCGECPCSPEEAMWQKYHIPDAGDCVVEPDSDGYYHVLVKDDCGCIKECRIPVVPNGLTTINYVRDSVPDDPDFPWYYGCYNDTINLHLAQNAPAYFGKFPLKVTVNYGVQVIKSSVSPNVNFRSLVVPVVNDTTINVEKESSILQGNATYSASGPEMPWGSQALRGSMTFIVPKGKEAYLHHEFRLRTNASFPNYATNSLDGQRVPDDIASQVDKLLYVGSRLNALQVIVEPTFGSANMDPVVDPERQQLDPAVDEYPGL